MKFRLLLFLTVFAALFCYTTQAQTTVEQWTFDGANPETGINGMTQNQWTTTAPNSVPSAGVLRYATDGNGNSAALAGGSISTSAISSLTLTIELTDMNIGSQVAFQFGEDGTGNMEVEFNTFATNEFSLDVEGNGIELSPAAILDQDDFAGAIPLVVAVTWDFENNEMRYTVTGSATDSQSISADLSGITSITDFRPRGGAMAANGTYLDFATITIETVAGPTTWTGATDSNWATASNWSTNTVPTATDNVVIPEVTNAPVIGALTAAVCNNLTITETDGVTVSYGGSLTVNGTSSGAINYVNYQLVPNGDFSNTADDLGSDGVVGARDWRLQVNDIAVATGDIFEEAGNNVFRAVVTTVPPATSNLRLRQEDVVCPATATKLIFRAKGSEDAMDMYVRFSSPTKTDSGITLTTSWVYYEIDLNPASPGANARLEFQLKATGTYYIDDVAFESPVTWTGATDSDWATASNWVTGVGPIATDDVLIPEVTTAPVIGASTAAVCNNLTVTETDGLVINSGGSLIVNGTSSGNVTYNRNLGTENWYLVSSPVVGETYDNAYIAANSLAINGINNAIGSYNTADNTWSYMQTNGGSTFAAGTGYSVRRANGAGAGNISFTGTINTSDVSVGVSNAGTGFNLLGNPFTSFINSATLLTDNGENLVSTDIWVFNQSSGNYEVKNLAASFVLAPAQGFFVRSSNGTNVSIAESYQTATGDAFQKTAKPEITLNMTDGSNNRFAKIYYLDNATTSFDNGYDGETFGGVVNTVDVFTHLVANSEGKKYQVQSLPNSDFENMVVPVGIKAAAGKEITFSAEAMNIPDGFNVYLEDRAANTVTLLSEANATYKVTLGESLDGIGRFYLHTKAS
ncbi:hypothetical protein IU405_05115, partial [Polaribacter sp. BAL334]|nr:hypothetical protein [Polaribacter sp. BAL334]